MVDPPGGTPVAGLPGVDLHTHLAPSPRVAGRPEVAVAGDGRLLLDGSPVGPADLYRPERLAAHLAAAGLDEAIVSIPPPFYRQHLPAPESQAWVAALNDGLLEVVVGRAQLTPLAYLPLEHPAVALAEYQRIGDDPRWAGVTAAAGGRSAPLDSPALRPLWSLLHAHRCIVQLHPAHSPDGRLAPYYLANLLGNPVETTVAAAQLVFGQVLTEFSQVRFLLVHCGGFVPAAIGRWERGHRTGRPGIPPLALPPAKAARRFYADVLAHDPAAVDLAVVVFGADRLVLGSDWPFPMGTGDPASPSLSTTHTSVPPADRPTRCAPPRCRSSSALSTVRSSRSCRSRSRDIAVSRPLKATAAITRGQE